MASHLAGGFLKEKTEARAGSESLVAALPDAQVGKTIVLKSENDVIIGQMARFSSPSAPTADINSVSASAVDRRKGKELLSIISQY